MFSYYLDNREPDTTVSTDQVDDKQSSNRAETKRRKRVRRLVSKLYTNDEGELGMDGL